jgi:hypothetical protein
MSAAFTGQAAGAIVPAVAVHVPATQPPEVVLHTAPPALPAHCESLVHLPHMCGVTTPQSGPVALAVQSLSARQLPGVHAPPTHKYAPA